MYLYPTGLKYYEDPYKTELDTDIIGFSESDDKVTIYLDATIFYPAGGGQPSDQGTITSETGKAEVFNVQMKDGVVHHECRVIEGNIEDGQSVTLSLDWDRRFKNMRTHTAGHIIHDILTSKLENISPSRGDHGSKPYLEYTPEVEIDNEQLEKEVNEAIVAGRTVTTRETDRDELEKIAKFVPPNLPSGKPLRIIQIQEFPAMPCGGTHVRDIKEIGRITIPSINSKKGKTTIKYQVQSD